MLFSFVFTCSSNKISLFEWKVKISHHFVNQSILIFKYRILFVCATATDVGILFVFVCTCVGVK